MGYNQADKILDEIKERISNYDLEIEHLEYLESAIGSILENREVYFGMEPDEQ